MAKKRVQHEIRIIILLAILSVVFFGLTFGIKAIQSHKTDETQILIDNATMLAAPHTVEVVDPIEPFTLKKTDRVWSCENDPEINVSSLKITMMRTVMKYFQPIRVIEDAKDKWSEFGLDHPQRVVRLISDEKTNTYLVGDYNPILDEYYLALDGDDTVFLMSSSDMKDFNLSLLGYVKEPDAAELEAKDLAAIKVETKEVSYNITNNGGKFVVDTGVETFDAGQYVTLNILTTFTSNAYLCVAHKATPEVLKACGLDDPEYKVTFTDIEGNSYCLSASVGEDGKYYARENEKGIIYRIEERSYNNLVERVKLDTLRG